MVAENYRYVLKKVEEACARSGRDPERCDADCSQQDQTD